MFVDRSPNHVVITMKGVPNTFRLKLTIPFDSARKMMAIIVKNSKGEYMTYVKGADTSILPRLEFKPD
jgi:magnesium-transporting ATPase (P-type)